ncbi:hypothetical protein PINS_up009327 [Pythium insidiosum]|nr:hypothetical protein PINS_up009327 [Pythium insidiosum]
MIGPRSSPSPALSASTAPLATTSRPPSATSRPPPPPATTSTRAPPPSLSSPTAAPSTPSPAPTPDPFLRPAGFPCPSVLTLTTQCGDKIWKDPLAFCVLVPLQNSSTPRCTIDPSCLGDDEAAKEITCDTGKLVAVASVPSTTERLGVGFNQIQTFMPQYDAASNKLREVRLTQNFITSLDDIVIPQSVETLDVAYNRITTLVFSQHLSNLVKLSVSSNPITRVEVNASGVANLVANNISLTSLQQLVLPPSIISLELSYNRNMKWANFTAPLDLRTFDFSKNEISSIQGVVFPSRLEALDLFPSNISCFVVRESDVAVLANLRNFSVGSIGTDCDEQTLRNTSTRPVQIAGKTYSILTLDDKNFEARYLSSGTSPKRDEQHSSSGIKAGVVVLIVVVAGALVAVLAIFTIVVYQRRKQQQQQPVTPDQSSSSVSANQQQQQTDVRQALAAHRIPQGDLSIRRKLAQGGYGIVLLATLESRQQPVVVKQLLPEKARDPAAIAKFMAEIRLCARLAHANIVAFLGISWSTLADLALVLELMPNGDLAHALERLQRDDEHRAKLTWQRGASAFGGRSKRDWALEIAEALAYLHALAPPVVHRDLKASNVLLSATWTAKLSDFGVSREVSEQQLMTAEVGTVAWIAPEVLRAEPYSERADVYSFGVVLSELDTCERPFARGLDAPSDGERTSEPSNARIALAVSEQGARPSFHADCPSEVLSIAQRCLTAKPGDRPMAEELARELERLFAHDGDETESRM